MLSGLEKALALRSAPMFAPLGADELLPIAALAGEVVLRPGATLFEAGEPGDALYVVVAGAVEVRRGEQAVATLGPGECVGELAALDWEPRSATVVAREATELVRLDRDDLLDLLADHPAMALKLAGVLVARLRRTG